MAQRVAREPVEIGLGLAPLLQGFFRCVVAKLQGTLRGTAHREASRSRPCAWLLDRGSLFARAEGGSTEGQDRCESCAPTERNGKDEGAQRLESRWSSRELQERRLEFPNNLLER